MQKAKRMMELFHKPEAQGLSDEQIVKKYAEKCVEMLRVPAFLSQVEFIDFEAENKQKRQILNACQTYAKNFSENQKKGFGLMLLGNVGCGKTMLGYCIAKEIARQHFVIARIIKIYDLLGKIKKTYHKGSDCTEDEVLDDYSKTDLLIIDEIGVQKFSDFEVEAIFKIINARYERMLPTIIISNMRPEELADKVSERTFDRLVERTKDTLIFNWDSHRRR